MLKKYKQLITGIILGALLFSGVSVVASNGLKSISVMYNNIKIAVDGKEIKTGSEPFVYNGSTYVPIRVVSEALGAEVNWNDSSKTVEINKSTGNIVVPNNSNSNSVKKTITYEDLARNGRNYLGEEVKFIGKIVQVIPADGNYIGYRVNVVKNNNDWEGTVYLSSNFDKIKTRFLEGDIIEFTGTSADYYSYTSVRGTPIEIPYIFANSIEINSTGAKTLENSAGKSYKMGEEAPIYDNKNNHIGYLKIINVSETTDRNKFEKSNPRQVVKIDYEYRNIASLEDMYISHIHFQIIGANGEVARHYPNINRTSPQYTPEGSFSKGTVDFGLDNVSEIITLNYKKNMYSNDVDIKFELPIK